MIKKAFEKYKEKNGVTPLDIFNYELEIVDDMKLANRLGICAGCPKYVNLTKQCMECGCHMPSKAKFDLAKCPLEKW